MKRALRSLAASRRPVPSTEDQHLVRALRQIAFSPATKIADRLRAIELLGKHSGLFKESAPPTEDAKEDLTEVILQRLKMLRQAMGRELPVAPLPAVEQH